MSCTKIIIWSAIFINDIWILANPHQNWIVHVWTAKDSWRTLEYSWNDYFGILPTAIIQDTSNFKANNHLNRNKSSVLKQYNKKNTVRIQNTSTKKRDKIRSCLFFISKGEIRTLDLTGMSRALSPAELPCHKIYTY